MLHDLPDDWVEKFEEVYKSSLYIDNIFISDQNIKMLCESHRDKLWRLQIDNMYLIMIDDKISIETIEVLNKIKLNIISIKKLNNSFEKFKMCLNLSSMNIKICF